MAKPTDDSPAAEADPRFGPCHVCGIVGRRSFEHVPPKKAFNDSGLLGSSGRELFEAGDPDKVRKHKLRKGAGAYTLCERCNNVTGAAYGTAYIEWAYQGMRYQRAGFSSLSLPYFIYPARVAKQIVCMFASTCPPDFVAKDPTLQNFVLNRDARGLPSDMRLYCYMVSTSSTVSRSTGIVGQMTLGSGRHFYAETSFVPFGYILTVDGSTPPDAGLMDITFFTHHGYNDWRDLHLIIPRRDVNTYFPGDFRSIQEWEDVKAKRKRNPVEP